MMELVSLRTSKGQFTGHLKKGRTNKVFVLIPGLHEARAGHFYMWRDMAHFLQSQGHGTFLFDLAGQGDCLLPLSFAVWKKQIEAIRLHFMDQEVCFVSRGISAALPEKYDQHISIYPALIDRMQPLIEKVRWTPSLINNGWLTPKSPKKLSPEENKYFHLLGAEAECIGCMELPEEFVAGITSFLPKRIFGKIIDPKNGSHPLFEKLRDREKMFQSITNKKNIQFF